MKICQEHWNRLRTAIEERGLSHFVAKDGKVAANNMVAELQGANTKENYDPLMAANFAIWGNALECWGIEMMTSDACPLCALDKHAAECTEESCNKQSGSDWIRFAADGQFKVAQELGLLGEPN
jgi:hypothetical protein